MVGVNVNGPQAVGGIENCTFGLRKSIAVRVVSCIHPSIDMVRSLNVNVLSEVLLFSGKFKIGLVTIVSDKATVLTPCNSHLEFLVAPL